MIFVILYVQFPIREVAAQTAHHSNLQWKILVMLLRVIFRVRGKGVDNL